MRRRAYTLDALSFSFTLLASCGRHAPDDVHRAHGAGEPRGSLLLPDAMPRRAGRRHAREQHGDFSSAAIPLERPYDTRRITSSGRGALIARRRDYWAELAVADSIYCDTGRCLNGLFHESGIRRRVQHRLRGGRDLLSPAGRFSARRRDDRHFDRPQSRGLPASFRVSITACVAPITTASPHARRRISPKAGCQRMQAGVGSSRCIGLFAGNALRQPRCRRREAVAHHDADSLTPGQRPQLK